VILLIACSLAQPAMACSNYRKANACSLHPYASQIFVGTVMEVVAQAPGETDSPILDVRLRVDEAFKGTSLGDVLTIQSVQKGNCCGAPPNFAQGSQFLIYLLSGRNAPVVVACDPVIPIAEADEHLTYLRNLLAHNVPTEVYGLAYVWDHFLGDNPKSTLLSGIHLTFKSDEGTFSTTTDEQGKFRRSLKPGTYELITEMPGYMDREGTTDFTLAQDSCAEIAIPFEYNGVIEGRVVDSRGKPAPNVAVSLLDPAADDDEVNFTWTGADGEFSLQKIAPGDYVLGFNVGPLPNKESPYAATFYPSAADRDAAATIHLGPGQEIKLADSSSSDDNCALDIRVLYRTGKPASGATLAAAVLENDRYFVLHDPDVVRDGRVSVPTWGHGQLLIHANLETGGGRLQSESQWVHVCSKKPVILKLNRRYDDPAPSRSVKSAVPTAK
jgi:5-hydroxyisourate hydrolase-like protein (transthyretin family)